MMQNKKKHPSGSKLTYGQVLQIRKSYATKKISQRELARLCNVTQACISYIVTMKRWKHI